PASPPEARTPPISAHGRAPSASMFPRPLTPPLFPYTTLFRSRVGRLRRGGGWHAGRSVASPAQRRRRPHRDGRGQQVRGAVAIEDRKSTRLNSSHEWISYAVFCLKKKKNRTYPTRTLDVIKSS